MRTLLLPLMAFLLAVSGLFAPARAQAPSDTWPPHPSLFSETTLRLASFDTTQVDRWLAADKAKHAGVSFLLTLSGQYAFTSKAGLSEMEALPLSMGVSASIGLAKELYDWKLSPTRTFSLRDLVADLFGIVLALGIIVL